MCDGGGDLHQAFASSARSLVGIEPTMHLAGILLSQHIIPLCPQIIF